MRCGALAGTQRKEHSDKQAHSNGARRSDEFGRFSCSQTLASVTGRKEHGEPPQDLDSDRNLSLYCLYS